MFIVFFFIDKLFIFICICVNCEMYMLLICGYIWFYMLGEDKLSIYNGFDLFVIIDYNKICLY